MFLLIPTVFPFAHYTLLLFPAWINDGCPTLICMYLAAATTLNMCQPCFTGNLQVLCFPWLQLLCSAFDASSNVCIHFVLLVGLPLLLHFQSSCVLLPFFSYLSPIYHLIIFFSFPSFSHPVHPACKEQNQNHIVYLKPTARDFNFQNLFASSPKTGVYPGAHHLSSTSQQPQ